VIFLLVLVWIGAANAEFIQTNPSLFQSFNGKDTLTVLRTNEPEGLFVLLSKNRSPQEVDPTKIRAEDKSVFLKYSRGKLTSLLVSEAEYIGQSGLIKISINNESDITITPSGFTVISWIEDSLGFLGNNFVASFPSTKLKLDLPRGYHPYDLGSSAIYLNGAEVPLSALGIQWQSANNYCFGSQVTIKGEAGVVRLSDYLVLVEPVLFNPEDSRLYEVTPSTDHEYETALVCYLKPL